MNIEEKIQLINKAIDKYFEVNPHFHSIKPDDLCTYAFKMLPGLKRGKQLRDVLRELDAQNKLYLIPSLTVDRRNANRQWDFINQSLPTNHKIKTNIQPLDKLTTKKIKLDQTKDEHYILSLCDELLQEESLKQYKFDFLCGDTGRKLPVDAYYKGKNLVIEYREKQHTESVCHFDKPDKITVSGVHRGEQRKIYDQRRRDVLPQHGINLIEISYSDFKFNSQKRIVREYEHDLKILREKLNKYL